MGKVGRPKGSKNKTPAAPVKKKGKPRNPQTNFGRENVEPGDNKRFLEHELAVSRLPEIDISDIQQVEERIQWYFQHCIDDDMKPTVTGMCNALGITKETLWNWKTGKVRKGTHFEAIKKYYHLLEALWEDYMMNGKVNPASGIFMGKNHFGYRDEVEVSVRPPEPLGEEPDRKLLDAKLADIVQELDEQDIADSQSGT